MTFSLVRPRPVLLNIYGKVCTFKQKTKLQYLYKRKFLSGMTKYGLKIVKILVLTTNRTDLCTLIS